MTKKLSELIPDFSQLKEGIKEFIIRHQNPQGFINTCNANNERDNMYCFVYDNDMNICEEKRIVATRVTDNEVEVLTIDSCEWISNEDIFELAENPDNWTGLENGSMRGLYAYLELAENIEEYI